MTRDTLSSAINESGSTVEQLHILPVSLLETHRRQVAEFLKLSRSLQTQLGWHYLLDLAWAAEQLDEVARPGAVILDAGAGTGLMQWWLADRGVEVISVDRMSRRFSPRQRAWCPIVDFRTGRSAFQSMDAIRHLGAGLLGGHPRLAAASVRDLFPTKAASTDRGRVRTLEGDLLSLDEVASGSIDAVVSISSLEHNQPDKLPAIVTELLRTMRPGGRLVATLGATKDQDWYHEPSAGWCYTEETLRYAFSLKADCPSNYADYDALFEALINCDFLRGHLSEFYFKSGNNGMPWGRWDPQYQSVGLVKVKSA